MRAGRKTSDGLESEQMSRARFKAGSLVTVRHAMTCPYCEGLHYESLDGVFQRYDVQGGRRVLRVLVHHSSVRGVHSYRSDQVSPRATAAAEILRAG